MYDIHKNQVFLTPCPHGSDSSLVDVHPRSTWNTHRSLEMASAMTCRTYFNFLCGRPHGAGTPSTWTWPPPCGRHQASFEKGHFRPV